MWLVARRLAKVYTQLCSGGSSHEPLFGPLAVLLEDDVAYRASGQFRRDQQYWIDFVAARPEPGGLTLSDRPPSKPRGSLCETIHLQPSTADRLRSIARRKGSSIAPAMIAAAAIILHRLKGTEDLVIGLPVASRGDVSRNIPGMVSNVVPLRLTVRPGMTVPELIEQTSRQTRRALKHQRHQLADIRGILARTSMVDRCLDYASMSCLSIMILALLAIALFPTIFRWTGRGLFDLCLRSLRRQSASDRPYCELGIPFRD